MTLVTVGAYEMRCSQPSIMLHQHGLEHVGRDVGTLLYPRQLQAVESPSRVPLFDATPPDYPDPGDHGAALDESSVQRPDPLRLESSSNSDLAVLSSACHLVELSRKSADSSR